MSVNATLDLSAGTLSSNTSSVLKLQAPTTLTSSNPVSFGAVSFEGNVLTLGSSSTHLKITDTPLSLGGIPLETGPGSLTLSGALSLSNQGKINSSGGSITLESGGSVAGGSTLSLPNTTLVLQSPLSIASSTLKTSNTTFTTNSNALTLSGSSNLYIEGAQDLSGVVPDNTSVLRLTGDTTLNGSSALSVYSLELEDHALTLHNSMGGLSVSQAVLLNASSEQINSGAADLSLSGGITVSSGTLASSGGTVSSSSLTGSGAGILNFQGGTLSLPNGASLASGATFTTSSTTIELGGNLDVSNTWASSNTNLSLTADAQLSSTAAVEAATLETNGNDFELSSGTTDLTLANAFTLSSGTLSTKGGDLIFKGRADISSGATLESVLPTSWVFCANENGTCSFSGTKTVRFGKNGSYYNKEATGSISCGRGAFGGDPAPGVAKSCEYSVASGTGGKLEFRQGGTNAGTINAANSVFKIGSGYVVTGTLKTNSTSSLELGNSNLDLTGATLELGGNVGLDKILTNNQTIFKLAEDATVTRNVGFTLGGIDLGGHTMTLGSATTDLTMNTSGGWKLIAKQANSDAQLFSSSARSTFLENENDSSQSTFMSIGNLDESNYADTDGKYKFKQVWGGKTVDSSGINKEVTWTQTSWLEDSSIQGFEEIGTSGHVTGNSGSGFRGLGKSSDSQCVIDGNGGSGSWWNCSGAIARHGGGIPAPQQKIASSSHLYIWESGTDTTDIPAGTLLTQAADLTIMGTQNIITGTTISSTGGEVTFKSELAISAGKVNLQDTTLVLEQGGGISGGGELDLSNSVLEISGQFHNNGGTFTTSGSTLRLTGNTNLANGGPLTFSNYEADGWRLNINDSATHLTLAGNVLLQPNNTVSSSSTIETNDADLTISGSVTLKDNASIQSSGGVINLNGSLALESGTVDVNSGTLNLSGGSVGEYGKLQVGGQATLNLGANLSASGTFNLHPHSVFNSGGNTLDASSGRLEIGGERSFDSIITNSSTSLQVNSYLDVSRTDSGTSTIGDLELIMLDGDSGSNSLNMSNMSLVVGGSASLDGKQIMLDNGSLSFQESPSLSNSSSLSVSGGELILESGGTFSNTTLNLSSSVFKPSGTVLLEGSSAFNINETSSIKLQGATTYTQSGTAYWPSIDLNGNSLTLNVTKMYCCAYQSGGLNIRGGVSLNSGTGEFTVDHPLMVEPGGTVTSGSGRVQIG